MLLKLAVQRVPPLVVQLVPREISSPSAARESAWRGVDLHHARGPVVPTMLRRSDAPPSSRTRCRACVQHPRTAMAPNAVSGGRRAATPRAQAIPGGSTHGLAARFGLWRAPDRFPVSCYGQHSPAGPQVASDHPTTHRRATPLPRPRKPGQGAAAGCNEAKRS